MIIRENDSIFTPELWPKTRPLKGTVKGTGNLANCRSVPRSFEMELVPVQFLKKGTSSRNERSFGPFLQLTAEEVKRILTFPACGPR